MPHHFGLQVSGASTRQTRRSFQMSLVLTNGPSGRRTGLSNRAQVASLLRSTNASAIQNRAMPPRVFTKRGAAGVKAEALAKEEPEEEDGEYLNRPPDSSDDEVNPGDIESTTFESMSKQPQEEEKRQDIGSTKRGKRGIAMATSTASTNTKSRRGKLSQASSPSHDSPKRKSQEEVKTLGTGMTDEWGNVKVKKAKTGRKSTYGGRNVSNTAPAIKHDLHTVSPKKEFKSVRKYDSSEESDAEEENGFKRPNVAVDDSPATSPKSAKKFKPYTRTETPDPEESLPQPAFKKPGISFDDSFEEANLDDSQPSLPEQMHKTAVVEAFPATQAPVFKAPAFDFDSDDALGTARSILEAETFRRPLASASAPAIMPDEDDDDDFQTMTQRARCPMCGESVDPADLRAFGRMNTRKQEKFCRSHRKTTALQTWDAEEYPTIDWDKLDSRITKHHSFIKKLINGADSHYRELLAETVNAGKNRSLLKSDYNPTPGYYGTRGLRAISENTMRKFTPLLKKRMVVDRLMAARGFTPYVEYVVVPEVAVKLIMEDMNCEVERAREIMSESLGVGELLSEEIKDVVRRTGSEEIEDFDE